MLVHLLEIDFIHQLGCRFDILDSISSFFCILTYAIICLDTSYHFLALSLLPKYSFFFFKYSCTNIFHRRSLCTFYSTTIRCMAGRTKGTCTQGNSLRFPLPVRLPVSAPCSTQDSPVNGEFPALRPVTWSFDVFFDLSLNKRFGKQSWGWWFETQPRPLRRRCN